LLAYRLRSLPSRAAGTKPFAGARIAGENPGCSQFVRIKLLRFPTRTAVSHALASIVIAGSIPA
jgi:hypothetical protein